MVDNVPITPVYNDGYRNILVVHLSRDSIIDTNKYPGAKIIQIVPKSDQGTIINGTLDFNSSNARRRIQQGYEDTKAILQPIYEMGMTQIKISKSIQKMKEDNGEFLRRKEESLQKRHTLINELNEVFNNG